jgi:type I restriction enzyme S subunit
MKWEVKKLGDLVESNVVGLVRNKKQQSSDFSIPYLKMNNITSNNQLDLSDVTFINASDEEIDKFSLREGDFLFNTRNSKELVGKSCVFSSSKLESVIFNNNIMRIRFKPGVIPKYIAYLFCENFVKNQLEEIYQRKIEALGELKQSILQKAFSGQLTQ